MNFIPGLSPAGYAVALRKELKLTGNIDPFEIAQKIDVPVYYEDLDKIDGCLLKKAEKRRILINKNILHINRQRFTLAHELGHLMIKSHGEEMYRCMASDIQRYRGVGHMENEANDFASELLLPEADVQSIIKKRRLSMSLVKDISEDYGISLTAAALKIIRVCPDQGAVALSEDGRVKWSFESKGFNHEIRKTILHENTAHQPGYACPTGIGQCLPKPRGKYFRKSTWSGTLDSSTGPAPLLKSLRQGC